MVRTNFFHKNIFRWCITIYIIMNTKTLFLNRVHWILKCMHAHQNMICMDSEEWGAKLSMIWIWDVIPVCYFILVRPIFFIIIIIIIIIHSCISKPCALKMKCHAWHIHAAFLDALPTMNKTMKHLSGEGFFFFKLIGFISSC